MARQLNDTIESIFSVHSYSHGIQVFRPEGNKKQIYMEIPIDKPVLEIPILAFNTFTDIKRRQDDADTLVVLLNTHNQTPTYTTVDSYMRYVLQNPYHIHRLIKLEVKQRNKPDLTYYGTNGTVFTANFTPIMMCSWIVKKIEERMNGTELYDVVRPIIRIDPEVFCYKDNPLEKFITNKFPIAALETCIYKPCNSNTVNLFVRHERREHYDVKIEIDKCPFELKTIDAPTISTTREALLDTALHYIDEIAV